MRWLPVLLVTAALFAAGSMACGGDDSDRSASPAGNGGAAESSPGVGSAASGQGNPPAAQDAPQKVVVNSSMELEVKQLRSAYARAGELARSFGGFVADATIDDSDDERSTAKLRLRVPATRHDELMAELRGLGGGRTLRETTTAKEITAEYTDLQSRVTNLRRAEAQYQELVKQATTVDAVLNVQSRLDTVRGQIEEAQGRLNLLDSLVDFSTLTLSLSVPGTPASEGIPNPAEVFVESWEASIVVARVLANITVVLAVVAIWLAIPATVVLLAVRYAMRHRPQRPPAPPHRPGPPFPPYGPPGP